MVTYCCIGSRLSHAQNMLNILKNVTLLPWTKVKLANLALLKQEEYCQVRLIDTVLQHKGLCKYVAKYNSTVILKLLSNCTEHIRQSHYISLNSSLRLFYQSRSHSSSVGISKIIEKYYTLLSM